jgi:hypothetical protein
MSANVNNFFESLINGSNPKYINTQTPTWTPAPAPMPTPTIAPTFSAQSIGSTYTPQTFPTGNWNTGIGSVDRFKRY